MTHSPSDPLLSDLQATLIFAPADGRSPIPDLDVTPVRLDGLSGEILRLAAERHVERHTGLRVHSDPPAGDAPNLVLLDQQGAEAFRVEVTVTPAAISTDLPRICMP